MSNSFCANLDEHTRRTGSLLCVGLDPHWADLGLTSAEPNGKAVEAARRFCLRLIEATADLAAAFKPNAAFFEALGPEGWALLAEVIAAVPADVPVILDAKRGDIATSAEAYVQMGFHLLGATAVTISPYLGYDSVEPFLADPGRGAFVLCKTSNPGSGDLQDLLVAGPDGPQPLYEHVARLACRWNVNDNLGLVAGATHPAALGRIRRLAPDLWILAPGVGAQGGDLATAMAAGLREDGLGLLIAVSRAVARAADPRAAAQKLVADMRAVQDQVAAMPVLEYAR